MIIVFMLAFTVTIIRNTNAEPQQTILPSETLESTEECYECQPFQPDINITILCTALTQALTWYESQYEYTEEEQRDNEYVLLSIEQIGQIQNMCKGLDSDIDELRLKIGACTAICMLGAGASTLTIGITMLYYLTGTVFLFALVLAGLSGTLLAESAICFGACTIYHST